MEAIREFGVTLWHRNEPLEDGHVRPWKERLFKISKMPDLVELQEVPLRRQVARRLHAMYFSKHFPNQELPSFVRSDYVVTILMDEYCALCPIRPKRKITHLMKRKVWALHVGEEVGKTVCFCCKMTPITMLTFNCGHIVAESNGGETTAENMVPICQHCNSSMGTTNLYEYMKN